MNRISERGNHEKVYRYRGRHLIMCNRCVSERYPDCIQNCAVEKLSRDFEEKMKQEQSESRE